MSDYLVVWFVYLAAFSVFFAALSILLLREGPVVAWKLCLIVGLFVFNLMPLYVAEGIFAPFLAGFAIDVVAGKFAFERYWVPMLLAVGLTAITPFLMIRFLGFSFLGQGASAAEE